VRHASNSTLMASQIRETVDSDSAASDPRASARVASTSRTERPRTKLAITRDSRALVRHTPVPSRRDADASVGTPELRAFEGDRARGGLDRRRAVSIATAFAGPLATDVAFPAQELGASASRAVCISSRTPRWPVPRGLHRAHARRRTADRCQRGRARWGYSFRHGCGFPFFAYRA
jgi:hypothetical protein